MSISLSYTYYPITNTGANDANKINQCLLEIEEAIESAASASDISGTENHLVKFGAGGDNVGDSIAIETGTCLYVPEDNCWGFGNQTAAGDFRMYMSSGVLYVEKYDGADWNESLRLRYGPGASYIWLDDANSQTFSVIRSSDNVDAFIVDSSGNLYAGNADDAGSDTDKFAVFGTNNILQYRTGAEVLSDIGALTLSLTDQYIPKANGTDDLTDSLMYETANMIAINSADSSDQLFLYHDNTNAFFKWNDGTLTLQTDEGTNTDTFLHILGKGTGLAKLGLSTSTIKTTQTGKSVLQIGGNASLIAESAAASGNALGIGQNVYHDGAVYKQISGTANATLYQQYAGSHYMYVALSAGGADSTITLNLAYQGDPNRNHTFYLGDTAGLRSLIIKDSSANALKKINSQGLEITKSTIHEYVVQTGTVAAAGGTFDLTLDMGATTVSGDIGAIVTGLLAGSTTQANTIRMNGSFCFDNNAIDDDNTATSGDGGEIADLACVIQALGSINRMRIRFTNNHATDSFSGSMYMRIITDGTETISIV